MFKPLVRSLQTTASVLFVFVFLFSTASIISGQEIDREKKLALVAATIDASATQIRITGENFGKQAPDVFLALENGATVKLESVFVSNTEAIAFYSFFNVIPGSYRLTVKSENGKDSMSIAIGAGRTKTDDSETKGSTKTPDIVPVESASGTYVDLTTNQTVGGEKTFTDTLSGTTINANQFNIGGNRFLSGPGFANVFVGEGSGAANTTGKYNVFSGYRSGFNNTTGERNSFTGSQSGLANTTGSFNVFSGVFSGAGNTSGRQNSFYGTYSGLNNNTGIQNAFVGYVAGYFNTTGSANAFFGRGAGLGNTTGSNNTLLGELSNVGTGALTYASAIGSGAVVTTSNAIQLGRNGTDVVRVGLLSTTAGATDVCLNASNELSTCSGGGGSFINNQTTEQATSNFHISGAGIGSIFDADTQFNIGGNRILSNAGTNNLFVGVNAGAANTTGGSNTANGVSALRNNTTGANNAAHGFNALFSNTIWIQQHRQRITGTHFKHDWIQQHRQRV